MHYTLQAFYDLSIGNQRWKIPEVLKEIGKNGGYIKRIDLCREFGWG